MYRDIKKIRNKTDEEVRFIRVNLKKYVLVLYIHLSCFETNPKYLQQTIHKFSENLQNARIVSVRAS